MVEKVQNATFIVVIALSSVACAAMLSHYDGFIEVKLGGSNVGQLTIDGRQLEDARQGGADRKAASVAVRESGSVQ